MLTPGAAGLVDDAAVSIAPLNWPAGRMGRFEVTTQAAVDHSGWGLALTISRPLGRNGALNMSSRQAAAIYRQVVQPPGATLMKAGRFREAVDVPRV